MILVDTSVWIDHLRSGAPALVTALEKGRVLMHPFVLGELACGNLKNRREVLQLLGELPSTPISTDPEALAFIEGRALMGRGIGYIDVHLLASVALAGIAQLWTRDQRLATVAADLELAVRGRVKNEFRSRCRTAWRGNSACVRPGLAHMYICAYTHIHSSEETPMSNIRWSVVVPEETDRALRSYLAKTGGKKGDISRFVDEAVQARLFEFTVEDVKKRNRTYSQEEIMEAIEETLG